MTAKERKEKQAEKQRVYLRERAKGYYELILKHFQETENAAIRLANYSHTTIYTSPDQFRLNGNHVETRHGKKWLSFFCGGNPLLDVKFGTYHR